MFSYFSKKHLVCPPPPTEFLQVSGKESRIKAIAAHVGGMSLVGGGWPRFFAEQIVELQERVAALEQAQSRPDVNGKD